MGRGTALTPPLQSSGGGQGAHDLPIDRDPRRIQSMFSGISSRYDMMNHLMTVGLDRRWRRIAAEQTGLAPGARVLDACCGTGDLTLTLAAMFASSEAIGLDFTEAMLERARAKGARLEARGLPAPRFVQGDLLALPFADGEFAAVTVGWGVRNVPDVPQAFAEMRRVTRPGGRVVCLESTQPPPGLGGRFHLIWMGRVVPLLGRLVTGDPDAYSYLPASVEAFPRAEELAAIMSRAGLVRVRYRRFGFGAVALHVGEVPG